MRFSQRVESVKKDVTVECTVGILKKRWRILKNHMLIQTKPRIDNIVFTCAIFHNTKTMIMTLVLMLGQMFWIQE